MSLYYSLGSLESSHLAKWSHQFNNDLILILKWRVIKEGLNKAAEAVLGQEKRRSPDWFQDNIHTLETLITKQNDLFSRWLRTHSPTDRQRYVTKRREVAHEIRRCKNVWFQKKAGEVEAAVRKGRGAWKGLRELQQGRAGLRPVRPHAIKDLDGNLCAGRDSTLQRWYQHFNSVLNVHSSYDPDPPTAEEVVEAMGKQKEGKAGGKNGILPEMVRGCGEMMMDYTLDMLRTVWMEERAPQEWRDALLVPIPKKGDLTQFDNWRGISLLDVMGKVFTKVIQMRLQKVAEEVLPDS